MHEHALSDQINASLRQSSEVASESLKIARKSTVSAVLSAIINQDIALSWFEV